MQINSAIFNRLHFASLPMLIIREVLNKIDSYWKQIILMSLSNLDIVLFHQIPTSPLHLTQKIFDTLVFHLFLCFKIGKAILLICYQIHSFLWVPSNIWPLPLPNSIYLHSFPFSFRTVDRCQWWELHLTFLITLNSSDGAKVMLIPSLQVHFIPLFPNY